MRREPPRGCLGTTKATKVGQMSEIRRKSAHAAKKISQAPTSTRKAGRPYGTLQVARCRGCQSRRKHFGSLKQNTEPPFTQSTERPVSTHERTNDEARSSKEPPRARSSPKEKKTTKKKRCAVKKRETPPFWGHFCAVLAILRSVAEEADVSIPEEGGSTRGGCSGVSLASPFSLSQERETNTKESNCNSLSFECANRAHPRATAPDPKPRGGGDFTPLARGEEEDPRRGLSA